MDPGDFFRKFFGLRRRSDEIPSPPKPYDGWNFHSGMDQGSHNEGDEEHDHQFGFSFGDEHVNLDDMFEHFHGNIFREMESLHRQMDEMIRGFGVIDFPGVDQPAQPSPPELPRDKPSYESDHNGPIIWSNIPTPFFGNSGRNSHKSPRQFMLKDEEEKVTKPKEQPPAPAVPKEKDEFKFNKTFSFPGLGVPNNEKRQDSDLDGKVNGQEVMDLIKKPSSDRSAPSPSQKHGFFSSGSSVTMTTVRGADGKLEQKRVVRDSSGREETTVTRSVGDKTHTVTTITEKDGKQEKREAFQNLDENDLGKFEEHWTKTRPEKKHPGDSMLPHEPNLHGNDRDLFSRLFGNTWR